ncbi:c-di-GMP-binding flagellar brake protein YcgR, contains PilZNR and PilZ domains [Lentibacillus halodurans]|uniref:C-di-GMP-binding flagellar brake protein YcgR, contains PilZNR and PilZ domains n=1 Tax=Lentibacillus halodurans TaxID=237679 RepID=A0A1I0VAQ5_9BACI|nr:PilZ domain-containing protein [Lentibacillus halodurans]SFA73474.1 c-di-GMP-binding flagellar brake protein YcgR, contains PilZNR and PilZ domains [Lentibacillus halodurans]
MKIGTALTMEINNSETGEISKYRSSVIEKTAHHLLIDLPIDDKTNKTVFLPEGTHMKITYIGTDQTVYMFHTEIAARVKENIPALAITFPEKEAISTIQRRQFVRIDTAVDVAVHRAKDSFTTVTADISGGGISVILPESHPIDISERLDIWIVLQMHSGDFQYIHAIAEVIRVDDDNGVSKASLKFVSINESEQQLIIRYCFEKQLESRKKELS